MPLIIKPSGRQPEPGPKELPIQIATPDYRGIVVDNRYQPLASLLSHVEGSSWTVDYYAQVLNRDSAIAGQNLTRDGVNQQYKKIRHLELKVTQGTHTTQDPASKDMETVGTANIYWPVIPNQGDMFIARLENGHDGVFQLTSSERKSLMSYPVHEVSYTLDGYADGQSSVDTASRRADLEAKTVQRLDFRLDFLANGQNPLVFEDQSLYADRLLNFYHDILNWYVKKYLSNEYKVLMIPGQQNACYDHFLTKAFMATVTGDKTICWDIQQIRTLNCSGDEVMETYTIWDALLTKNAKLLKDCNQQMGLSSVKVFSRDPMLEGIYHSGLTYVVYPYNPKLTDDDRMRWGSKPFVTAQLVDGQCPPHHNLGDLVQNRNLNGDLEEMELNLLAPLVKPVLQNNYYVFSKNFYDQVPNCLSALEICAMDYLQGRAISQEKLIELCETYHSWGTLERFYYIPVLLMLIKEAIRNI